MGNSAASTLFSFKVDFSRETPNDFYLSGDRVQGIIQIVTNDNKDDLDFKYGPLYVELVGELDDGKKHNYQDYHNRHKQNVQIFFKKQVQATKLPSDNRKLVVYFVDIHSNEIPYHCSPFTYYIHATSRLRNYTWAFDGLLDSWLPSSLPPYGITDPYICYYARVYLHHAHLSRKFSFAVFTRAPMPIATRQSLAHYVIEASARHKNVKLHGTLPNNGLVVPGQTLMLQLEIDNPMQLTIESIRATLMQYRTITDEETDFMIFSAILPGFKPKGFNGEYRQSTYELQLPLEKCRVMAPTSSYKHVRYELHIQCHIHSLLNNNFTLTLPIICTTDHQRPLKIMDGFIPSPEIITHLSNQEEEKPPPNYKDFIASEILPKYEDIIH